MRPPSELPKPVTVFLKAGAPSAVWVSGARIWRVKGRIWSRIGAVVCLKKRSVAVKAGDERLGLRDQAEQRRPGRGREAVGAGEAGPRRPQGRRELAQRFLDRLLLVGEVAEGGVGGGDEALDRGVVAAEFGGQQAEVVDHVGERDVAFGDGAVELGDVVGEGLEPAEGAGELAAATADPLRAAGDQQLQVALRVAVEGGEESIEVDVRFGPRERECWRRFRGGPCRCRERSRPPCR